MTIVCVDLDGTISADPSFYRAECGGLMQHGHQVHVLTGNPHGEKELSQLGMIQGRDYTRCITVPKKHIAAFKVAYMQRVGATAIIDNRRKNCVAATKAGFTAHHHMSPKRKD